MICLSPAEVVLLGTKIALELAKNRTADEIAVLRSLISQISSTLSTYSAQTKAMENYCKDKDN